MTFREMCIRDRYLDLSSRKINFRLQLFIENSHSFCTYINQFFFLEIKLCPRVPLGIISNQILCKQKLALM